MCKFNFKNDLHLGQVGERVIASYYESIGYKINNYNNDILYDIEVELNDKKILLEVKTDIYEYLNKVTTNNMFIEVFCNGKLSGISASKADIFIYYYPAHELAYMVNLGILREAINMNGYRRVNQSGEGGRVTGYLINRLEQNYFCEIQIKKEEFIKEYKKNINYV